MVHARYFRLSLLFAVIFSLSPAISPQEDGPGSDNAGPRVYVSSWSSEYHHALDRAVELLLSQDVSQDIREAGGALSAWRTEYQQSALLLYREILPIGEAHDDAPQISDSGVDVIRGRIESARNVLTVLERASRSWEDAGAKLWGESLGELIAISMVLMRPDITPSADFWLSMLHQGVEASEFLTISALASRRSLNEYLSDGDYPVAFINALTFNPQAALGFESLIPDVVSHIYHFDGPAVPAIRDDSAHSYNRLVDRRVFLDISSRPDSRWPDYLSDLSRLERSLNSILPASLSGPPLNERLFLPDGQFSDSYWALLSLLENPFYITNADRAAQVEQIYLGYLEDIRRVYPGELELYAALIEPSGQGPEFSLSPLGQARRYTLALIDGERPREGLSLQGLWSELSRGAGGISPDDPWHLQSGLYVVRRDALPADPASLTDGLAALSMLISVAEELGGALSGIDTMDPAIPYLLSLRRMMIFQDIRSLVLQEGLWDDVDLELRVWLNLNTNLLRHILAGEAVNIPLAIEQIRIGVNRPEAETQLIDQLKQRLAGRVGDAP